MSSSAAIPPVSRPEITPAGSMPRALETDGLPIVLAMALWPWIDTVERAGLGTADALRRTSEKAARDLRRSTVVTAPLETMLEDAVRASERLALDAARPASEVAYTRMDALLAPGDLIAWLRCAKPSDWAREAGVGW